MGRSRAQLIKPLLISEQTYWTQQAAQARRTQLSLARQFVRGSTAALILRAVASDDLSTAGKQAVASAVATALNRSSPNLGESLIPTVIMIDS